MKNKESHMSNLTRILKNAGFLLGNRILIGLINLIFISYLARHLSQEGFGMYTTILTFLAFAGIFADFGISTVLVREIAQNKTKAGTLFSNSLFLTVKFSLLAWLGIVAIAIFLNYPKQLILLIVLAGGTIIFNSLIGRLTAVLSAFERMDIFSSIGVVLTFLFTLIGILLLRSGFGLTEILVLMVVSSIISTLVFFYIVQKGFIKFKLRFDIKLAYSLLKQASPIFILLSFGILLNRMDIVMLSRMRTMQDVGIYGAAVQLNEVLGVATGCFLGALFPFLSSQWKTSLQTSYAIYRKSLKAFIIFSCFLTMILFLLSRQIIPFIFGKDFVLSSQAFRILIWAFWLNHIGGPIGLFLIVQKTKLKKVIFFAAIITGLNFILNLILIPKYSYIGASASTVFCSFLLLMAKIYFASTLFENCPSPIALVLRPSVAALLVGVAIFSIRQVFFPVAFFIGIILYIVFLIILGELKINVMNKIFS